MCMRRENEKFASMPRMSVKIHVRGKHKDMCTGSKFSTTSFDTIYPKKTERQTITNKATST